MKFGIVVCPGCNNAKAVDLSFKTTKCYRCGKILILEKLKIFYKSDSNFKIRQALGLVNAKMDDKFEEFKDLIEK